jgi:rRNA maturation RNase YbeY
MILYNNIDVKMPKFPKRRISNWIKQIADSHQKRVGEVSVIFCSDANTLEINSKYLTHNYFTDVITFDYSANEIIAGDIFISIDTVCSNAAKYKTSFLNELYRVIIHGILHLCGLTDKTITKRKEMTKAENEALKYITI